MWWNIYCLLYIIEIQFVMYQASETDLNKGFSTQCTSMDEVVNLEYIVGWENITVDDAEYVISLIRHYA